MQLKNECMCRTAAIWTLFIFFPGKRTLAVKVKEMTEKLYKRNNLVLNEILQ